MTQSKVLFSRDISENLIANIESRDVVLWVRSLPKDLSTETVLAFLGMPWRLVISEVDDTQLLKALEEGETFTSPMNRKRGFIQVVDTDPARIELPERCLPIYLLNGRKSVAPSSDFESRLRRMTMLESLRRSGAREIVVLSCTESVIPPDLEDLWSSGFRSFLTFVTDVISPATLIEKWFQLSGGAAVASIIELSTVQAIQGIVSRYAEVYPEHRITIRVRDRKGIFHRVDITETDDSDRPVLDRYTVIEERDLAPLVAENLSESDFMDFFRDPESSWLPYAAGLPWMRSKDPKRNATACLRKLDLNGADENCIAYISSESGAGGTTLARTLAWELAKEGYPVLYAKSVPFVPDALPIANFLNRVKRETEELILSKDGGPSSQTVSSTDNGTVPRYETPWVIVFDSMHWRYRDNELMHFRKELQKQGRPVCILVVTGSSIALPYYNATVFKNISELNHSLDLVEAQELGTHLNKFLRVYGKERKDWQWKQFYDDHTVRYLEGVSAFWVTLSFWLQGQFDLSESIQQWVYRSFKENITDEVIQRAILEIAALSSERLPLPEGLLPVSKGNWPVSVLLEDLRQSLASLGLTKVTVNGEKHWALVHDILGRLLINALFYDFETRQKLGYGEAKDAEYLRFMVLRQISAKRELGERAYTSIGEDFSTSIFKIDQSHGRSNFISIWPEVLAALDNMPRSLRDTSRVFRHHVAITRRRITKLDEVFYGVTPSIKIDLLNKAIDDINYALTSMEDTSGESNLNLYNSLANAYFDLAAVEAFVGSSSERISELRKLANEATRKAYEENPANSFVIETYVKNLLTRARESSSGAVECCIEALGVLLPALATNEGSYRRGQLGDLADQTFQILLEQTPDGSKNSEPTNVIEILTDAWIALAEGGNYKSGIVLSDIPQSNRDRAFEVLQNPLAHGSMQAIRLTFDLICIDKPYDYKQQLDLVQQLQATDYRLTHQLRLEYAILLFQNGRAVEGDKVFKSLRQIWREGENFVYVPERLRWLREIVASELKVVHAITGSDYDQRAFARVQEFSGIQVPFRAEEFGLRTLRPGLRFTCHVSFGHNGPFLRPVTAQPSKLSRGADV